MSHCRHIMSLTTWKPTMTTYTVMSSWWHLLTALCEHKYTNISVDLSLCNMWYIWVILSSSCASCYFHCAIVRNRLQLNWIQHLPGPSIQVEHLSDAFTQNVCSHHDRTKQKIRIFFSWSHHSPNWLNLSALFSFPLETKKRLHILNLSVHLDCKEGEPCLSSFWLMWSRHWCL